MDLKELIKTEIWELYEKSLTFMHRKNIFSDSDTNFRMFNGDQWAGLKVSGIEKIQYNVIKPIVKHKVSTITSNLFAINYSPENIENSEFLDAAQKSCDLLNKMASKTWDKDFMDSKVRKWARQACINDEAIAYVTYNEDLDMPINEIISKNDIMYGDENDDNIQEQPYILIRQRKPVMELKKIAEENGVKAEELESIRGDSDTSTIAGIDGKDELEDKCWLITKFYKKDGTVHFSQSTQFCEIKKDEDTGLTLYPIAHFNWEDNEGSARGIGEVRGLIPNQLEINKTAMRRAAVTKSISYPQRVINVDAIDNINDVNKVGATIKFKDMGNTRASDVFMMTSPGQMGVDSEKLQTELIQYSRELNNASEITTGSVNPEQASGKAILAVQNAQNQPLTDQLQGLKAFIEDIARIWFDMWKVYPEDALKIENEIVDPMTNETTKETVEIPSYILDALSASVKVDITPRGSYDRYAQELSLENLFKQGGITFEEYVKSLDSDSVMPKAKLEMILEARKEAQRQIQNIQMQAEQMKQEAVQANQNAQDINNIEQEAGGMLAEYMGNQEGNQATA